MQHQWNQQKSQLSYLLIGKLDTPFLTIFGPKINNFALENPFFEMGKREASPSEKPPLHDFLDAFLGVKAR